MDGTTPKSAADVLAASTRSALQCLGQVEIVGSGWNFGILNSFRVIPRGNAQPGTMTLRRSDRSPYLRFKVLLDYQVLLDASGYNRPVYRAEIAQYMYGIQDLSGRELFAYHLHPYGVSDVWSPHLHVRAAADVSLPGISGHEELALGKLHFPTQRMELPRLVRFLIIELGVEPRRADWEAVLDRVERSDR